MPSYRTRTFEFEGPQGPLKFLLNSKSQAFGRHKVDHYWIPLQNLKPTKVNKPGAYRTICEAYRIICMNSFDRTGAEHEDWEGAAKTHVLAQLLPYVRSRGALNVFNDAKESRVKHREVAIDRRLEKQLKDSQQLSMSESDFCEKLAKMQTVQSIDENGRKIYQEFEQTLLAGVVDLWRDDPDEAVRVVRERWTKIDNKFGRRAGYLDRKEVLDILSYECAGAFRRCHSAVWAEWLLPRLKTECGLSRQSYRFHEHWHQLIVREDEWNHSRLSYPFLGHCLGLHPASGRFMKTNRCKELIGEWLDDAVKTDFQSMEDYEQWMKNLPNLPAYGRLLHGYFTAYIRYDDKYDDAKSKRERTPLRKPGLVLRRRGREPGTARK